MTPSEVCQLPLIKTRGAERRQALGCSGTRRRASDVGPQALLRRLTSHDAGRSPLGAPPRRFLGSGPAWARPWGGAHERCPSVSPGAFARSARGGGRAVLPDASRVLLARQQRRTPHPALPMRCLAKSTLKADGTARILILVMGPVKQKSDTYQPCAVDKLLMGAAQTVRQARRHRHNSHQQKSAVARAAVFGIRAAMGRGW